MITVCSRADLDIEAIERIAFGGERLAVSPGLLDAVEAARHEMLAALAAGARVYGVNTGMGYLAGTDLTPEQQRAHQHNLLLGRAVGSEPWLTTGEARAVLVARLGNLLSGHSGASAALCAFLADRLNDGFTPAIPRHGAGSAGDIIPLAHAFQTLVGVGATLDADGSVVDAAEALRRRGIEPYAVGAKEGIALLAGAAVTVAAGVARRREARPALDAMTTSAACAIDALGAPLEPYDAAVADLAGDPILAAVLHQLRAALDGADPPERAGQAPVSFRVSGQVLAHVCRELDRFTADLARAVAATSDSPAFVAGRFVTTGGFHEIGVAAGMDGLAAALIRAAELSAQRLHRLLDGRFTGLPDQLAAQPGPQAGLVVVHKRAVGAVSELRRLAAPASIGIGDTSLGQEDAMTFGLEAANKLRRVVQLANDVTACELLASRQAWALRATPPAPGLAPVAEQLTELVPAVGADRPLGPDLARLGDLLAAGALARPAGAS